MIRAAELSWRATNRRTDILGSVDTLARHRSRFIILGQPLPSPLAAVRRLHRTSLS